MDAKIVECPRDAMQGIKKIIPTELKVEYLNLLLKCGFDTLDFGSFVSPKAIPQLSDTADVLKKLNLSSTKLLSIIANLRGAEDAVKFPEIDFLGFPFSLSETFQRRNTNIGQEDAFRLVQDIQSLCIKNNKTLVVYLSMGFGNPYGDEWNTEIVSEWALKMKNTGIQVLSLADTIGAAQPEDIQYLFKTLIPEFKDLEIGAHFHTTPNNWIDKVDAAYNSGCRRFDGALKGFGGCPMAADELTGNLATENLLSYLNQKGVQTKIHQDNLKEAMLFADQVFAYH